MLPARLCDNPAVKAKSGLVTMSFMSALPAIPDLPQVLLLAVALNITYFIANTIITYRKLRHVPGPRLAAFSQLWLFNVTAKGDVYLSAEQVLRKYGMHKHSWIHTL